MCVGKKGPNASCWVEEGWLGTIEAGEGQWGKEHTRLLSVGLGVKRYRLGHEQRQRSDWY